MSAFGKHLHNAIMKFNDLLLAWAEWHFWKSRGIVLYFRILLFFIEWWIIANVYWQFSGIIIRAIING